MKQYLRISKIFNNFSDLLTNIIFYFAILFFIIGFGFRDTPTPFGWYQQWMPGLGGRSIKDITLYQNYY